MLSSREPWMKTNFASFHGKTLFLHYFCTFSATRCREDTLLNFNNWNENICNKVLKLDFMKLNLQYRKYPQKCHGSYKWIIMHEKCGRPDSNGFQLKWRFGTHGNWKNKILGAVLELPAKQHCQFCPFGPTFEVNGLDWQCYLAGSSKLAPRILIFSIAMAHMGAKPLY